jgi:hypothetical protein
VGLHNLAHVELGLGRVTRAETPVEEALAPRHRLLPPGHAAIAASVSLLREVRAAAR